ncbi:MAG: DUF2256 domain-containing protein [Pusillimonas sp.]
MKKLEQPDILKWERDWESVRYCSERCRRKAP